MLFKSRNKVIPTQQPSLKLSTTCCEAKDVSIYYGKFKAIKNVSLTLDRNKVTAFIGPSGCGKSTMLRAFYRMNEVKSDISRF